MAHPVFDPTLHLDIIDGNIAKNFCKWKRQMQVYMNASGSLDKEHKRQTSIILNCAGPKVIEIYDQFEWEAPEDKDNPNKVFDKIENYCNPRKNEVFESHRFWNTNIDDYTSFEHFLTELRKRVESCNFNDKNRMIRDKIVFSTSGNCKNCY